MERISPGMKITNVSNHHQTVFLSTNSHFSGAVEMWNFRGWIDHLTEKNSSHQKPFFHQNVFYGILLWNAKHELTFNDIPWGSWLTFWEWKGNLNIVLRMWSNTPIIIPEYNWMPRDWKSSFFSWKDVFEWKKWSSLVYWDYSMRCRVFQNFNIQRFLGLIWFQSWCDKLMSKKHGPNIQKSSPMCAMQKHTHHVNSRCLSPQAVPLPVAQQAPEQRGLRQRRPPVVARESRGSHSLADPFGSDETRRNCGRWKFPYKVGPPTSYKRSCNPM